MRGTRTFAIIISGLMVCAFIGCGKKKNSGGDDPTAAVTPAPTPTPQPAPPGPQPNDGTTPSNNGFFPIGLLPMDPMNGTVEPPVPKVDPTPMVPPVIPKDPLPKPDDKKDPPMPPVPMVVPPGVDPKLPPPKVDDKKDPMKVGSVFVWPTEIGGKDAKGYIKDLSDPDPAIKVIALQTLPLFGPTVKKASAPDGKTTDGKITYGKAVLARMNGETESDPWVRLAAFELVTRMGYFEDDLDPKEAVRILGVCAQGNPALRPQAVQTLGAFGSRGEPSVQYLIGGPVLADPSYQTRLYIATTLGQIGIDEKTGPNPRALNCLVNVLIHDKSVAVRLEAMQALVVLGPPHHKESVPNLKIPGKKIERMIIDTVATKPYIDAVKKRLAPHVPKAGETLNATGVVEPNKQVEIWARVVLMRFDPVDEVNKENLDGVTKYIKGPELGPKIQGMYVLGMLGEIGARRIDDVVRELANEDPYIVYNAATALAAMGPAAKPAIPELEKLKMRGKDEDEKKYYTMLADEAIKAIKDPPKAPKKRTPKDKAVP